MPKLCSDPRQLVWRGRRERLDVDNTPIIIDREAKSEGSLKPLDNEEATKQLEALLRQDERYRTRWWGKFTDVASLEKIAQRLAYRTVAIPNFRCALPHAIKNRRDYIIEQTDGSVLLVGDSEGLSLELAPTRQVTVIPDNPHQAQWLQALAEREQVEISLHHLDALADRDFDVCVIGIHTAEDFATQIHSIGRTLKNQAVCFIGSRAPTDRALSVFMSDLGLQIVHHLRECDPIWLGSDFVLNGDSDWIGVTGPWSTLGEKVRAQPLNATPSPPYYWWDFDQLEPRRLDDQALLRLSSTISARFGAEAYDPHVVTEEDRQLVSWTTKAGHCLSFEMRPSKRHLWVTMTPYDPRLEIVVFYSVLHCLGGRHTRNRPNVTSHWFNEQVVA